MSNLKHTANLAKDIALLPMPDSLRHYILEYKIKPEVSLILSQLNKSWVFKHISWISLRCTNKSQVFLAKCKNFGVIIKRYSEAINYEKELYFLTLSQNSPNLIKIMYSKNEGNILFLKYLPNSFTYSNTQDIVALATSLGEFHLNSFYWSSSYIALNEKYTLKNFSQRVLARNVNLKALLTLNSILIDKLGPDYIPFAIIDFKLEHVLIGRDGKITFIDMETVQLGYPGFIDFLALPQVCKNIELYKHDVESIILAYFKPFEQISKWTLREKKLALHLTTESFNLMNSHWFL